jgi:L-rhamnose mutarotase
MFHTCLILTLKPGCLQGYREAHDALWPGIAASMADNGVNMAIHHHDGLLFVFATAPDTHAWQRSRECPELEEWNTAMTAFLQTDASGQILFQEPEQVFGFGAFER